MFVIRDAVWEQLAEAAHAEFVKWLRAHLREFFAEECSAFDHTKLGQFIEFGIKRARQHGFEFEADISKYVDLMCVFGPRFDEDPMLPWARRILESRLPADASERIRRLQDAAFEALERPDGG